MMRLKSWHIAGFAFTVIFGALLHFFFDWSGESPAVGLFAPVNESTWEHLKLLFFPMLLFGVLQFAIFGRKIPNFVPILAASVSIGMAAIVVLFYTYTGIVGQNYLPVDIAVFVIGALLAYSFSYRNLGTELFSSCPARAVGWVVLALYTALFLLFTNNPPQIGLFLDPVTRTYGLG